mmetsp:Transcript_99146/g.318099  ORF Transcript_99146/g.318099 Transcript_99146/m.318099 type:complete len:596 (-) Transcript_99146:2892-4679(-)
MAVELRVAVGEALVAALEERHGLPQAAILDHEQLILLLEVMQALEQFLALRPQIIALLVAFPEILDLQTQPLQLCFPLQGLPFGALCLLAAALGLGLQRRGALLGTGPRLLELQGLLCQRRGGLLLGLEQGLLRLTLQPALLLLQSPAVLLRSLGARLCFGTQLLKLCGLRRQARIGDLPEGRQSGLGLLPGGLRLLRPRLRARGNGRRVRGGDLQLVPQLLHLVLVLFPDITQPLQDRPPTLDLPQATGHGAQARGERGAPPALLAGLRDLWACEDRPRGELASAVREKHPAVQHLTFADLLPAPLCLHLPGNHLLLQGLSASTLPHTLSLRLVEALDRLLEARRQLLALRLRRLRGLQLGFQFGNSGLASLPGIIELGLETIGAAPELLGLPALPCCLGCGCAMGLLEAPGLDEGRLHLLPLRRQGRRQLLGLGAALRAERGLGPRGHGGRVELLLESPLSDLDILKASECVLQLALEPQGLLFLIRRCSCCLLDLLALACELLLQCALVGQGLQQGLRCLLQLLFYLFLLAFLVGRGLCRLIDATFGNLQLALQLRDATRQLFLLLIGGPQGIQCRLLQFLPRPLLGILGAL